MHGFNAFLDHLRRTQVAIPQNIQLTYFQKDWWGESVGRSPTILISFDKYIVFEC